MSDPLPRIEYMTEVTIPWKPAWNTDLIPCDTDDPMAMPVEHLEARICELAGHLTAATCQFLLLLADFDARRGWASWEMPSCAAWLSWKCQIAAGTAREHVRVARLLGTLPLIRQEFAAGRLSYAKVRALTRIATPDTEKDLVAMATQMTANQLERFAQAHRRVTRAEQDEVSRRRKLTWRYDQDKAIGITVWLPPADGAVVLQALRAWTNDLEHPHDAEDGGPARTRAEELAELDDRNGVSRDGENPPWQRDKTPAGGLADAIVGICGGYLAGRASAAASPDPYQVVIHAGTGAITAGAGSGVSAETTPARSAAAGPVPAYLAISPATLQMIACNAAITTMLHDAGGAVLDVGRRTRKPSAALRRAARERDRYRCRFPGCESRRIDLHHIKFWANGGETKLANIICLCKRHHALVHDKGIIIAPVSDGFAFFTAGGTLIPASPRHSGERLDLHLAIWTCFANARTDAARRERQQAHAAAG